jgi:hypothetical protein
MDARAARGPGIAPKAARGVKMPSNKEEDRITMSAQPGTPDTFPKLLLRHAQVRGALPAIREKDLGIWQSWT